MNEQKQSLKVPSCGVAHKVEMHWETMNPVNQKS
uniref:Uncharacterized protein n=1 Tax=Rhizophora mucronata TaxID=61149 RepID=A0A2P2K7J8_RHIMU